MEKNSPFSYFKRDKYYTMTVVEISSNKKQEFRFTNYKHFEKAYADYTKNKKFNVHRTDNYKR